MCATIADRGGEALAVPTDVTVDAQIEALADAAVEHFGASHIWVNNAGGSTGRVPMRELARDRLGSHASR